MSNIILESDYQRLISLLCAATSEHIMYDLIITINFHDEGDCGILSAISDSKLSNVPIVNVAENTRKSGVVTCGSVQYIDSICKLKLPLHKENVLIIGRIKRSQIRHWAKLTDASSVSVALCILEINVPKFDETGSTTVHRVLDTFKAVKLLTYCPDSTIPVATIRSISDEFVLARSRVYSTPQAKPIQGSKLSDLYYVIKGKESGYLCFMRSRVELTEVVQASTMSGMLYRAKEDSFDTAMLHTLMRITALSKSLLKSRAPDRAAIAAQIINLERTYQQLFLNKLRELQVFDQVIIELDKLVGDGTSEYNSVIIALSKVKLAFDLFLRHFTDNKEGKILSKFLHGEFGIDTRYTEGENLTLESLYEYALNFDWVLTMIIVAYENARREASLRTGWSKVPVYKGHFGCEIKNQFSNLVSDKSSVGWRVKLSVDKRIKDAVLGVSLELDSKENRLWYEQDSIIGNISRLDRFGFRDIEFMLHNNVIIAKRRELFERLEDSTKSGIVVPCTPVSSFNLSTIVSSTCWHRSASEFLVALSLLKRAVESETYPWRSAQTLAHHVIFTIVLHDLPAKDSLVHCY